MKCLLPPTSEPRKRAGREAPSHTGRPSRHPFNFRFLLSSLLFPLGFVVLIGFPSSFRRRPQLFSSHAMVLPLWGRFVSCHPDAIAGCKPAPREMFYELPDYW